MAVLQHHPSVKLDLTLRLTEAEARALDALVGYGFEPFRDTFYQHLGSHYLEPHEEGLKTLFESVRQFLPGILSRMDEARKTFHA